MREEITYARQHKTLIGYQSSTLNNGSEVLNSTPGNERQEVSPNGVVRTSIATMLAEAADDTVVEDKSTGKSVDTNGDSFLLKPEKIVTDMGASEADPDDVTHFKTDRGLCANDCTDKASLDGAARTGKTNEELVGNNPFANLLDQDTNALTEDKMCVDVRDKHLMTSEEETVSKHDADSVYTILTTLGTATTMNEVSLYLEHFLRERSETATLSDKVILPPIVSKSTTHEQTSNAILAVDTCTFITLAGGCGIAGRDAVIEMLTKEAAVIQKEVDKLRKNTSGQRSSPLPSPYNDDRTIKNLREWVREVTEAAVLNGTIYALLGIDRSAIAQNEAYSALKKMLHDCDDVHIITPHYGKGYEAMEALLVAWNSSTLTIINRQRDITAIFTMKLEELRGTMTPLRFMGVYNETLARIDRSDFSDKNRYITFVNNVQCDFYELTLRSERMENEKDVNFDNPALSFTDASMADINDIWAQRLVRLQQVLTKEYHRLANTDAGRVRLGSGHVRHASTSGATQQAATTDVEEEKPITHDKIISKNEQLRLKKAQRPESFAFACENYLRNKCQQSATDCLWIHDESAPRNPNYGFGTGRK
jgi:hypothetical protein